MKFLEIAKKLQNKEELNGFCNRFNFFYIYTS